MLKVNENKVLGWLKSHNITYSQIAEVCHVSENVALSWISPRCSDFMPDLAIVVLWNHFELGKELKLPEIE